MAIQLTVFHTSVHQFVNAEADVLTLNDDCSFAEGPVWCKDGYFLFSDIPQNKIFRIAERGDKELYLDQSGCQQEDTAWLSDQIGSNGLAFNQQGELLICQHGNGAIAVVKNGKVESLLSEYDRKRFNSPNDLAVHSNGTLFFSDPPYGLAEQKLSPEKAQPIAGIYCYREGKVHLLSKEFQYPNGICLSPDEQLLYCCSNKPFEKFVLCYHAETLAYKGIVAHENGDGIICDLKGNLYLCTKEGLLIIDAQGNRLALIELPTIPANCCWGGFDGTDLLVTARENIFLLKNLLRL